MRNLTMRINVCFYPCVHRIKNRRIGRTVVLSTIISIMFVMEINNFNAGYFKPKLYLNCLPQLNTKSF